MYLANATLLKRRSLAIDAAKLDTSLVSVQVLEVGVEAEAWAAAMPVEAVAEAKNVTSELPQ